MATTISIKYGDIPSYLHESDFFRSLTCEDPNDEFEIPAHCFAPEDAVKTVDQFATMLHVISFWGLSKIPVDFIQFCGESDRSILTSALRDSDVEKKFGEDLLEIFLYSTKAPDYLARAMKLGRTEFVTYFIEFKPESIDENSVNLAAELGHVEYLALLRAKGQSWNKTACEKAAAGGHLECLRYLRVNGCAFEKFVLLYAAKGGHLNCLQYAYAQGLVWTDEPADASIRFDILNLNNPLIAAVRNGHLECLRFLLDKDSTSNRSKLCADACERGDLEILQLLHERGAPWDEGATFFATVHKHLPCLKYLTENGCPWGEEMVTHAARTGSLEILQYVVEHGHRGDSETLSWAVSTEKDSFACVQYLIEGRHVPLGDEDGFLHVAFFRAVAAANVDMVRYLAARCSNINKPFEGAEMFFHHFVHIILEKLSAEDFVVFDAKLRDSIAVAIELGWDLFRYGAGLVNLVRQSSHVFPLSSVYVQQLAPPQAANVPRGY